MTMLCKVDCLDFTIPNWKRESYLEFLGAEICWLDRGFRGYKEMGMLSKGGHYAFTMGRDDGHFNLSGKALSAYIHDYARLHALLGMILNDGGNVSRIDLAVDVKESLKMSTVLNAVYAGKLVSRCKTLKVIDKIKNNKDFLSNTGNSIYVGSEKSQKMLRIYDKAKEQEKPGNWVRFELQLRDDVAYALCKRLVDSETMSLVENSLGVLSSFVDFRLKDNDNISRRTRLKWFEKILGGVDSIVLVFEKKVQTLEGLLKWIEKQMCPSLAVLSKHYGESFESIITYFVSEGERRLRPKHYEMLA